MNGSANNSMPPASVSSDRRRSRRPAAAPRDEREFEQWDFAHLSRVAEPLYRTVSRVAGGYAIGGTGYLMFSRPAQAMTFALISVTGWLCLEFWLRAGRRGVPAFAALVSSLVLLNSLPLLTHNAALQGLSDATMRVAGLTVAFFLVMLCGGWWLGAQSVPGRPSKWNLLPAGASFAGDSGLKLSLPLLGLAVLFKMSVVSGLLFRLLPENLTGLFSALQAFSGAATLLGAFLGGLAVARLPLLGGALIFWTLFALDFLLDTSSVLLSAASGLVIACGAGLGLRRRRIPWAFLIVLLLVVGFLNQGKFVMRERYWNPESGEQRMSLSGLPSFFAEWADVSLAMFKNNWQADPSEPQDNPDAGQPLIERLDNFRNLTFIVDKFATAKVEPLYGRTYMVIPALLIPRVFWPDKPRTHEGQIMLNLHFGRQASEEETVKTYIAWGLLPEAVGNFGCAGGGLFLGLVAGFLCGGLESWSARKRLLSVEGLVAAALLVQLAVSYEMVASVLITAMFQMLVAVVTFGILLHLCLKDSSPVRPRRRGRKTKLETGKTEISKGDNLNAEKLKS
ncbi:MAG TPA: hypothetical protein VNN22_03590 [Verrucomicrobiae bacterium]|nr:hypothetical protein [Verrucomicrobiae bacterium]